MALNANKLPSTATNYTPVDPGTYPARLVSLVDLGLQAQREFQGEPKAPAREIALTYELVDEFMKDEDDKPDPKKPRWITEILPFHPLNSEKAKSTKRYLVFDPNKEADGDWVQHLGKPVNVTIIHNPGKNGRIYENVSAISAMRPKDAEKCEPLVNDIVTFDFDAPDKQVFDKLPKFLKDKLQGSLEYAGSALEKLVGKASTPAKQEPAKAPGKASKAKPAEADDDIPY